MFVMFFFNMFCQHVFCQHVFCQHGFVNMFCQHVSIFLHFEQNFHKPWSQRTTTKISIGLRCMQSQSKKKSGFFSFWPIGLTMIIMSYESIHIYFASKLIQVHFPEEFAVNDSTNTFSLNKSSITLYRMMGNGSSLKIEIWFRLFYFYL